MPVGHYLWDGPYVWADGVHFNIRLEEDRQCILVLMGATADGKKELIAVVDGFRESEQSWKGLLLDVKACALAISDRLPDDGLPVDAIGIEEVEAFERPAG
jgi:transposase-like protein